MQNLEQHTMQPACGERYARKNTRTQPNSSACLRCREQKLKCDLRNPKCARCVRVGANCVYPDAPNRRGPRTKRKHNPLVKQAAGGSDGLHPNRSRASESSNTGEQAETVPRDPAPIAPGTGQFHAKTVPTSGIAVPNIFHSLALEAPVLPNSHQTQLRKTTPLSPEPPLQSELPLPPTALGLSLLEIYFTRIYNASLLFHKPTLFQQYLEGRIHGALVKALFALATLFLQSSMDETRCTANKHAELKVLSAYHSSGLSWAKAAQRQASSLAIESPSLMIVQALQCLQHYWFGIGEPHCGNLCLALAYRSCQMLGFDKRPKTGMHSFGGSLEAELSRRCFWACWMSTCIVMEPEPYIDSAWKEVAMLPLPGSIRYTLSGYTISFNQRMDVNWNSNSVQSSTSASHCCTALGSLIKIIGVRAKIQLLCKDYTSVTIARKLASMYYLSRLATSLFDDAIAARNPPCEDEAVASAGLSLLHDAVYHQSQIVLHSMIVPLFSGIQVDDSVDLKSQSEAAETVLHHADLFARLLTPYFNDEEDVSRLPPLLGYSAFVVGMVFLSTEFAQGDRSSSERHMQIREESYRIVAVKAIVHLLYTLKTYWRALHQPWKVLRSALDVCLSVASKPPESTSTQGLPDCPAQPMSATAERQVQPTSTNNLHPRSLVTESSEKEPGEAQNSAVALSSVGCELDGGQVSISNEALTGQLDLASDCEWYTLSMAEAGAELFAGFESFTLLQHGWTDFS